MDVLPKYYYAITMNYLFNEFIELNKFILDIRSFWVKGYTCSGPHP